VADDAYARIECIRLNKDCAEMCWTTAAYMLRESRFMEEACKLCADICDASTVECDRFAEEHCVHCSAACRDCAAECRRMMEVPVVQAV
jgi:hypothetical protein